MKKLLSIFVIIFIGQCIFAQPEKVTIEIFANSLITSDSLSFQCIISNPTERTYKFFGYLSDWEKKIWPQFWELIIINDSNTYMDKTWDLLMIKRLKSPEIKLIKRSIIKFNFTLSFNKLCKWSELSKNEANYINQFYGIYKIRIRYIKELYDPKNPISLESNWLEINYIKS